VNVLDTGFFQTLCCIHATDCTVKWSFLCHHVALDYSVVRLCSAVNIMWRCLSMFLLLFQYCLLSYQIKTPSNLSLVWLFPLVIVSIKAWSGKSVPVLELSSPLPIIPLPSHFSLISPVVSPLCPSLHFSLLSPNLARGRSLTVNTFMWYQYFWAMAGPQNVVGPGKTPLLPALDGLAFVWYLGIFSPNNFVSLCVLNCNFLRKSGGMLSRWLKERSQVK